MKLSEYQRSRSLFDLGQRSLRNQSLMFNGLYTQVRDSGPFGPLVLSNSLTRELKIRVVGLPRPFPLFFYQI